MLNSTIQLVPACSDHSDFQRTVKDVRILLRHLPTNSRSKISAKLHALSMLPPTYTRPLSIPANPRTRYIQRCSPAGVGTSLCSRAHSDEIGLMGAERKYACRVMCTNTNVLDITDFRHRSNFVGLRAIKKLQQMLHFAGQLVFLLIEILSSLYNEPDCSAGSKF